MALRTLTFGDLESGVWGAAWNLGGGTDGFGVVGTLGGSLTDDWRLVGDAVELEVVAGGMTSQLADGFDELVMVRGRLAERTVDCLGRRGERHALDPGEYESIRDVSAWFTADDGLALVSARAPGSRDHGDEVLTASAFEDGRSVPVADPRLSTTYDKYGSPIKAGLELWVERPAADGEETVLHPLRAAGEAVGEVAKTVAGALAIEARLFRWHARGQHGAGVYLIVRRS
jgi:hypothetical protein